MDFFIELAKRWVGESPKTFKILRYILFVLSAIALFPVYFDAMQNGGIPLPTSWEDVIIQIAGYATFVAGLITKLTLTGEAKKKAGLKD